MISTNDFKNGMVIEVDGKNFTIVEFLHVKPGKGGAFVRTKLKNIDSGAVLDKTFRSGEKFRRIRTESKKMLYLYSTPEEVVLMDNDSYEQVSLSPALVGGALEFVKENIEVDMLLVDEQPSQVIPPTFVALEVTETEPGMKGDTASGGGNKPATLENGSVVHVPLFVKIGDLLKIDTRTGDYVERV